MTTPPYKTKLKKRRKKILIPVVLLLVALGGYGAFRWTRRGNEEISVKVDKVTRRNLTETVIANGKIQPVTQVLISPEVAGEIIQLPVVEGQLVKKGDLLVQIRPDTYRAGRNSAEASYKFALGSRSQAEAELAKAESDFKQNEELSKSRLIPASTFLEFKTSFEVAKLRLANSIHQVDQAKFALDKAEEDLAKTTITAPIDGTIARLKSQLGERVLGTSFNMGTEMMTIAQLDQMEARVDIGEIDIVLIAVDQPVQLEVDAFKDRKFSGTVTAIANASKGASMGSSSSSMGMSSQSQEAPKFEVKIRINDKAAFRPGMSVTAEIETRTRKDVLAVPIQSVTTRLPTGPAPAPGKAPETPPPSSHDTKKHEPIKPREVVFALEGDHAKMIPVTTGISDSDYFEIVSGVTEGQTIISGGFKAISKDLEDGKKVKVETGATPAASPPK
jgi:HlyD family secretion protein